MPISTCTPIIAAATVPISTAAVPPIQNISVNTSAAAGTESSAATKDAGAPRRPAARRPGDQPEHAPADQRPDQRHERDVDAERGQPAVGEEQRLHQQDHGEAQHARIRPDEDRRQRPAQQVTAGAGGDREVEHLHGEDEGGDQPRHRGGPVVELAPGAAQADRDPGGRDRAGARRIRAALKKPSGTCTTRSQRSGDLLHFKSWTMQLHIGCITA